MAVVIRNGLFKSRPSDLPPGAAILRISAVRPSGLDLAARKYVRDISDEELEKFSVRPGDLLLTRYNGSRNLVGMAALVPNHDEQLIYPDKLIRVALDTSRVDARFVNYQLASPRIRAFLEPRIRTTAGQSGISGVDVKSIPIAVPTLSEQRRIVDLLEGHLSRLDAADAYVSASDKRTSSLTRSILESVIPLGHRDGWCMTTVGGAGRLQLGRARHPDWHHGPEIKPYLRVANVFEDRIVTDDVMTMDFTGVFEKYRLHPGDILLNEGQSPHLLGRPAIYRGDPAEVAFTNSLIRFQASETVLPEWALLVFRRHMHSGRFRREARITTNIAHLSMARLKEVEFPIPPLEEQVRRVAWAGEALLGLTRMRGNAAQARKRSGGLRRALLESAFSGRLTGRSVAIETAEKMAEVAP